MNSDAAALIENVESAIRALRAGDELAEIADRLIEHASDGDATRVEKPNSNDEATRVDGDREPIELCRLALRDGLDREALASQLQSWLDAQREARQRGAARGLFQLALDEGPESAAFDDARYIDGAEIGAGGMGRIHSVFDTKLQREVARKVITEGDERAARSRFLREARLTSQLEHPNIVPVYDVHDERSNDPSFTMRLVRGRSLEELVSNSEAGTLVARLDIFRKVCDGIAYAHSRGVIHRDIKPANVMVGEFGEVLVMDWGLAKALDSGPVSSRIPTIDPAMGGNLTMVGTIAGTPQYMAPEQARGELHEASTRTDVYALGALLYFLVTEGPPFRGASDRVIDLVKKGELESPRRRARDKNVPRELDAVVMKAMALQPDDRYQSVVELRDEVQAFLEGRPLGAMQYGPWDLLKKWAGRHRTGLRGASIAGVLFAVLLVAMGARYLSAVRAARDEAIGEAERARKAERESTLRSAEGFVAVAYADAEADRLFAAYRALDQATALYDQVGDTGMRARLGYAMFDAAYVPPLRAWTTSDSNVYACMTEKGDRAITVARSGGATLWELPSTRALAKLADPSGNETEGRSCVLTDDLALVVQRRKSELLVHDMATGKLRHRIQVKHDGPWHIQTAQRAGRVFVLARPNRELVSIWNLETGAAVDSKLDHTLPLLSVAHDGKRVTQGLVGMDQPVKDRDTAIVEVETGKIVQRFAPAERAAISPDGTRLLTLTPQPELVLWSVSDGAELWRQSGANINWIDLTDTHVFTEDHARNVRALRAGDGVLQTTYRGTEKGSRWASSSHSPWMIGASEDGLAQLQAMVETRPADGTPLHPDMVLAVAMSPGGDMALTGCEDGSVRLWDVPTRRMLREYPAPDSRIRGVDYSPDGGLAVAAGMEGGTRVWELHSGRVVHQFEVPAGDMATSARFVGDSEHVVIAHLSGALQLWRIGGKQPVRSFKGHNGFIWQVVVSPDGKRIASTGRSEQDRTVRIWDVASGKNWKLLKQPTVTFRADYSPDGGMLAVGRHDRMVLQWPMSNGKKTVFGSLDGPAMGVAYSPDGSLLAATDYVGKLRLFAVDTQEVLASWSIHHAPGGDLAFSSSGRWLASSGDDGRVVFLDLEHQARYRKHSAALETAWKGDAAAWLNLAELAALGRAWPTAQQAFEKARSLGAEVPALSLARVQWAAGSPAVALKTLERLPTNASTHTLEIWRAALKSSQTNESPPPL